MKSSEEKDVAQIMVHSLFAILKSLFLLSLRMTLKQSYLSRRENENWLNYW